MPKMALELKFACQNLRQISPCDSAEFRWILKLKCTSCGEISDRWHDVNETENYEIEGSRGTANFVHKCKLCAQKNNLNIVAGSVKAYDCLSDNCWQRVVCFDCRGVEPVDFMPNGGWSAVSSESATNFPSVSIDNSEWIEYDEAAATPVSIESVQHRFVKV